MVLDLGHNLYIYLMLDFGGSSTNIIINYIYIMIST